MEVWSAFKVSNRELMLQKIITIGDDQESQSPFTKMQRGQNW